MIQWRSQKWRTFGTGEPFVVYLSSWSRVQWLLGIWRGRLLIFFWFDWVAFSEIGQKSWTKRRPSFNQKVNGIHSRFQKRKLTMFPVSKFPEDFPLAALEKENLSGIPWRIHRSWGEEPLRSPATRAGLDAGSSCSESDWGSPDLFDSFIVFKNLLEVIGASKSCSFKKVFGKQNDLLNGIAFWMDSKVTIGDV